MPTSFELFGRDIPFYGVCFWVGIALGCAVMFSLRARKKIEVFDLVSAAVFTMIGVLIGSKGLFLLITLPEIIENDVPLLAVIKGGFVFYGGMLGGLAGLCIYVRMYRLNLKDFLDLFALAVPLGHAVGRVGCFISGCCYGIEYSGPLCYTYSETLGSTPLGVPLLPIQLIESAALLILFAVNLILYLKNPSKQGRPTSVYLIGYAVIRFVIEFFRGDRDRGIYFGLSTAQWVSIGIVTVLGVLWILSVRKAKKAAVPEGEAEA